MALPTGIVTLLFTDIVGSTRLWERDASSMRAAIDRHDLLIGDATRAREVLGWRPRTSFAELVTMMVDADLELVERQQHELAR